MTNTELEQLVKSGALKTLTWTKGISFKGPLYTAEFEGKTISVTPRASTTYKPTGPGSRLRSPAGTRYMYQVDIDCEGCWYTLHFGAVVGEGNHERVDAKKAKITKAAAKWLGLEIDSHDYRFRY